MKAKLEFNLPEQADEYEDCIRGAAYKAVIAGTYDYIRQQLKYNSDNLNDDQVKMLQHIRTTLTDLEHQYGVNAYD